MNYLVVYDAFEESFTSLGLAILEKASNVKIKESINGDYLLSFVMPRNSEKWQYIKPENFVKCEGQIFRIRSFEEERDSQGRLKSNIQCEHAYYDAVDCKFIPLFQHIGSTPRQILEAAFHDTRFKIGDVEIETPTDIIQSKTNPARVLGTLVENVGGEVIRDNWTIHLVQRRGAYNGIQFRFGKNVQGIRKSTDAKDIVTRLYPYGKDDLDITSVNGGVPYIESPLVGNYDRVHARSKDYKYIEDPAELLATAQAEFSTEEKDGIDKPRVTYHANVLELKKLKEYGDIEAFGLGDTARVMDEGLGVDTLQRIIDYERYPYEAKKSTVVLINHELKTYEKNTLEGLMKGLVGAQKGFEKITTDKGEVNASYLENIRSKLQTEINAGYQKAVMHSHGDVWVDNIEAPTKAMALIGGMFAIANSRKENGDWNWRTIGNADGIVADAVVSNWVYAGTVNAEQIIGGTISGVSLDIGNGNFTVDADGNLISQSAKVTGEINADSGYFKGQITSEATITGATFKTAAQGQRIEIQDNSIKSYNENGSLMGLVTEAGDMHYGDVYFYDSGLKVFEIYNNLAGSGVSMRPANNAALDVGATNHHLRLYGQIQLNDNLAFFGGTPTGKISANTPSSLHTTEVAGSEYSSNEQAMLEHLKTDVENLRSALSYLIVVLKTYNLV